MIILLLYVKAHIFILETLEKLGICYRILLVLLLFMHLLDVDYNIVVPYCITFLRRKWIDCKDFRINACASGQNLCVENTLHRFKNLHLLKIQDRITYKILTLTYKSYYNIAPTYLCELVSRREIYVNTRLKLIMAPISKDCSNTFLERSFIYAAPCEWNKLSEYINVKFWFLQEEC